MTVKDICEYIRGEVEILKVVEGTPDKLYFGYIHDAQLTKFGDLELNAISSDYEAYPLDPDDKYETEFYYISHIRLFVK